MEEARTQVWRLWAARRVVPYPAFGLTSVLDGQIPLPAGIDATVAGLDPVDLRRSALVVAELLDPIGTPSPFASYVGSRLRAAGR